VTLACPIISLSPDDYWNISEKQLNNMRGWI
jgi:hypothetical protein